MQCPKCDAPGFLPEHPCAHCGFQGAAESLEELACLNWVLDEVPLWRIQNVDDLPTLRKAYEQRRQALKTALGLQLRPLTPVEIREASLKLYRQARFRDLLLGWLDQDLIRPAAIERLIQQIERFIQLTQTRLESNPGFEFIPTHETQLATVDFLLDSARQLHAVNAFTSSAAEAAALAPLKEERAHLTPRPIAPPVAEITPPTATQGPPETQRPTPQLAPVTPPRPAIPFRERLVRSLLSERTLHAILFLGTFLLFSAAVTFVIWGWKDFSPSLRVTIPAAFTLAFFALSWYMRTRTALSRSGVALEAIAALLIPIDFYTAYVNIEQLSGRWAEFWLLTSMICVFVYILLALRLQSPFFGYLIATAAGSVTLATVEIAQQHDLLSRDWYAAALALLALGLMVAAALLHRYPRHTGRWQITLTPMRTFALLLVGILMPLALGWRAIDRTSYDTLHTSATVVWWLGGILLCWGAMLYGSRSLGLLAVISFPVAVTLTQAALFDAAGTNAAWHAFGWAWLTPVYIVAGRRLASYTEEAMGAWAHIVNVAAILLIGLAALWSLTDLSGGAAAAASHAVLVVAVGLAAALWRRPCYLYPAALLALTAATFAMTELAFTLTQLSLGWATLSLLMAIVALRLPGAFANPVVRAAYVVAALAILPPLYPYDGDLAIYTLGNWIALAGWGAYLAHIQRNGFGAMSEKMPALFHWFAALPLPAWLWMLLTHGREATMNTVISMSALAWGMVALGHGLTRASPRYRRVWRTLGLTTGVGAVLLALWVDPRGFGPALTLIAIGLLMFLEGVATRRSADLMPAGLATAIGLLLLLDRLSVSPDAATFALSLLTALYILAGLLVERRRQAGWSYAFLKPLYIAAHVLTWIVLARVYRQPFTSGPPGHWTDTMKLWGAASQLALGVAYGFFAWARYQEGWAHAAAWLGTAAGGLIFVVYSQGRGSSAAKVALLAAAYVLAERAFNRLREEPRLVRRSRAFSRLVWSLYRRPLLVAGWTISAGAIGLALIRNLWLLGGGRIREIWAIVALLTVAALYALSARLFRRPHFAWLAAFLLFTPWTLLTRLGWFTPFRLTLPGFAASWAVLAWVLYAAGKLLERRSPPYAVPFRVAAHLILPFSLLWGLGDAETSRVTFALAVGLYGWVAGADFQKLRAGMQPPGRASIGLYPTLGLVPIWCLSMLAWHFPHARYEHSGLLLLIFGPLGLLTGELLWRRAAGTTTEPAWQYALPAYLTAYVALIAGTRLVAHMPALLALVLLYDALMMLISARLFGKALWLLPAGIMTAVSLLIALHVRDVEVSRRGWWLLGLAAIYLALAHLLRRARHPITARIPLTLGLALIALALLPSSQTRMGALWGFAGAVLLYAVSAFWLKQPLLLTAAACLFPVPYALFLAEIGLRNAYQGLALMPGALLALTGGVLLDRRFGAWHDFPWSRPKQWLQAVTGRALNWWALPMYTLGLGLATAAPLFAAGRTDITALGFLLLLPFYTWALYRFRRRGWLLALGLAAHFAVAAYLAFLGWWHYPAYAWLRFLPVTACTTLAAIGVQLRHREPAPTSLGSLWAGWSRPLYALALVNIVLAQVSSGGGTNAAAQVTLGHAVLLGVLASVWQVSGVTYVAAGLGIAALLHQLSFADRGVQRVPVALAQLALGYGLLGFGLGLFAQLAGAERLPASLRAPKWSVVWERSMQIAGLVLSFATLTMTLALSHRLAAWTLRAIFGIPFRHLVDLPTARMASGVLALLGLLYMAASVVYRRLRVGYLAVAMLLVSWLLYAFYIRIWDSTARIQWYAIPAGAYLLGLSALEWSRGHKTLARRLDYVALLLMFGSLFWQTLLYGWNYALLLAGEGLLALWWGSGRCLRRFLYGGMVAVMLATLGQLVHSLQSVLQWIVVSVVVGLGLFLLGAFVERNLGTLKASLQEALESWE
jgi:hypothetical protein